MQSRWSLPRVSDDACSADCGQSPNPKRAVARPATGHVKEEFAALMPRTCAGDGCPGS